MDIKTARAQFLDPPPQNRPVPFWFWNDHLDPERAVWQFDQMTEAGTGGAVIHARGGLESAEYLDEKWFETCTAVVEHAAKKGKIVWLYDELGWPSGTAGGRVPREHPELQSRLLQMYDIPISADMEIPADIIAAFVVTKDNPENGWQKRRDHGTTLIPDRIEYEEVKLPVEPAKLKGKRLLAFRVENGGGIDYMNPDAAHEFIKTTHEEYYKRYKKYFGTTITHVFMDEAGMFSRRGGSLPWTPPFAEEFEKRRGHSILSELPKMFFDVPCAEAARFDFWTVASELFREGFGMILNDWCNAHNIVYSGHYVFETSLKDAIKELGSTMPLYEFQGLPGIDVLGNDMYSRRYGLEAYAFYTVMMKQAASVTNQLSKGGLLSESHGVGGSQMLPEDMQAVNNYQMAMGVTLVAEHAPFYSIRGQRKLDHPPIIGWQNPYWKFAKKHLDATSRTGWLLEKGQRTCDVLMLHASASMQASYRQLRDRIEYKEESYIFDADMLFEQIEKHFNLLAVDLLDAQIDFEYGDEELMDWHGDVRDGRLVIGDVDYGLVIIPPSYNIRRTTLDLLQRFSDQGGRIVMIGSAPRFIDGRPSSEAITFFAKSIRVIDGVDLFDYGPTIDVLTDLGARSVTAKTANGEDATNLKVHRRTWDGMEITYLTNIGQDDLSISIEFPVGIDGRIEEWDTSSGKTRTIMACKAGESARMELSFAPKIARTFVAVPGEVEIPTVLTLTESERIVPEWKGVRNDPNLLLIDACTIDTGAGETELMSVSDGQAWLAENGAGCTELKTRFPFQLSKSSAPSSAKIAVEYLTEPDVILNGTIVELKPDGELFDPANHLLPVTSLKPGVNELKLTLRPESDSSDIAERSGPQMDKAVRGDFEARSDELQSPILAGNFRVTTDDNITFTAEPGDDSVEIGSWMNQGMPFYTGTVTYSTQVTLDIPKTVRVVVELPGVKGCAQIRVNGEVVDTVLWPPYSCDITAFVKDGENAVEIEVANTLRNIYGPHYLYEEYEPRGINNNTYLGPLGARKVFKDYGLLTAPEIVVSR
jgi:hypothetical protein